MKKLLCLIAALSLTGCANTNTPTGQAIAAGLNQQAHSRAMGVSSAPQRTGMQDFFARGGGQ